MKTRNMGCGHTKMELWREKKKKLPRPCNADIKQPISLQPVFLLANLWQCLFSLCLQRNPVLWSLEGLEHWRVLRQSWCFWARLAGGTCMYQPEHGGGFGCQKYPAWASTNMLLGWLKQSRGFSWHTETNPCESSLCSRKQSPWR